LHSYDLLVAATGAVFVAFGALSRRLELGLLTAPMLRVALGIAASQVPGAQGTLAVESRVPPRSA
jgi:hypothetical protein